MNFVFNMSEKVEELPSSQKELDIFELVKDLAAAYLSKNEVPIEKVGDVLKTFYKACHELKGDLKEASMEEVKKPAVPVADSITKEYLICLEDGKKLRMLKRHLRTSYGLTPDAYRQRWGLPSNYPMVAPMYAEKRSSLAKANGLGLARRSYHRKVSDFEVA